MGVRQACKPLICAIVVAFLVAGPAFGSGTGVITTKADEFDPAASATYVAWNVYSSSKGYLVYAKPIAGARFRVNAAHTNAWVGGIDTDGSTLIYQQWTRRRSDIYAYDLATRTRSKIAKPASTDRWEY